MLTDVGYMQHCLFSHKFNCITVDSQGDVVVFDCSGSFGSEQITGTLDHLKIRSISVGLVGCLGS